MTVLDIGCVCFGLVIGFITYRTLVHTNDRARISDLAAVLATVGGGAVTALFPQGTDAFAWYAIGLAVGMAVYFGLSLWLRGRQAAADVLNQGDESPRPR
jgi:hypothetical protein